MKITNLNKPAAAADPAYLLPWIGTLSVFAVYVLVNLMLFNRVMELLKHVANPFFVVLLVVITVAGQLLTIGQTWRLLAEGKHLDFLTGRLRSHEGEDRAAQAQALHESLKTGGMGLQVTALFGQLLKKDGQAVAHDQARLQQHFDGFGGDIQRRTILAQYIANTLIGLGLFGTFLGLIVTLKEVAALIGLFGTVGAEGSSDMMAQFFQKMSAPLGGMGDAFVASLLGLGGSIVNNLQLLATRKLQRVLVGRAEENYFLAAEAICMPHGIDQAAVQQDMTVGEGQLKEMRAIRTEMHQQTEAILLASSRMRQVTEPLVKSVDSLEKLVTAQAKDRPQLEQIAAAMEQRIGVLVHKFEETQQAHHGLLNAVRAVETHLGGISGLTDGMADEQRAVSRKLSELTSTTVLEGELQRQALREQCDSLKTVLHDDLRQVSISLEDSARTQREQALALGGIDANSRAVAVAVETAGHQLLQQGAELQPQLTEIIARVDKLDITLGAANGGQWQRPDEVPGEPTA